MSQYIDGAPDTPGDVPVAPRWRSRLLTSMPVDLEAAELAGDGEGGPERLTRHERVPEDGHQRGR